MRRNILISYFLAYLYSSWFWLGIWVFYYLRFTDYRGIGIIESIMITMTMLLDIPTGVITDRIGKKKSLFIAFLFCGIGNILFGFSTSFQTLIFSVSFFCLGSAFYSGTFEALQYDSLKSDGLESTFKKVASRSSTITLIAYAASSLIGGFLYKLMPGLPFILVGVFHLIGVVLTLFLIEPEIDSEKSEGFKAFLRDQVGGFKELTKNAHIRRVSLLLGFVGIVIVICSQVLNDLMGYEIGFTPVYFGMVSSAMYLVSAIVNHHTPKLSDFFGEWNLVLIASFLLAISLLVSPVLAIVSGTVVLSARWVFQSVFDVTSSIVINHQIDSSTRATTLSTFNFIKNIPYAFMAILIGDAMDGIGVRNFTFYLGLALTIFIVFYFIFIESKVRLNKERIE